MQTLWKLSDIQLDDLTEALQKQVGVEMLSYDLKIGYLCEECMKRGLYENRKFQIQVNRRRNYENEQICGNADGKKP